MAVVYRTDGAWGSGIGSPLTAVQADTNFYTLVQQIADLEDDASALVNQIETIEVIGSQMLITMQDASTFGPFTLPIARFTWRGTWAVDTDYDELDLFFDSNYGLFMVIYPHTSDSYTFDPSMVNEDSQLVYYQLFGVGFMSFSSLADVPPNGYTGKAGYELRVSDTEDGIVYMRPATPVTFFFRGTPTNSQLLHRQVWDHDVIIYEDADIDDFDTVLYCTAASSTTTLVIKINGSNEGTITVNPGLTGGLVVVTIDETVLVKGDVFEVYNQASADATFANFAITIPAFRYVAP